ncbi:MAG: DUF4174 domain-containing protein [Gammaproteobacteria bacterium]|nr:DUF4174 domain-containing protein [Gammaproteobacteria bacterium]
MSLLFQAFFFLLPLVVMAGSVSASDTKLSQFETEIQARNYESLSELEWKYRVILVKSNDPQAIETTFTKFKQAIDDRQIAWFLLHGEKLHSNLIETISSNLSSEIKDALAYYRNDDMVLIGYDGEIKSSDTILNIAGIFEQIDRMPIRQYEMTNK